jgi:hypothetical protein
METIKMEMSSYSNLHLVINMVTSKFIKMVNGIQTLNRKTSPLITTHLQRRSIGEMIEQILMMQYK